MMTQPAPLPDTVDGRRQRSEASRERMVRAMIDLIRDGDVTPSAEAVATRAGVGLRTVFRHFENMESLYQQINTRVSAEIRPIATQPFLAADWPEQLVEMIDRRADIFERILPLKIAADVHRHHSPFLAAQTAELAREQRAALCALLPQPLAGDCLLVESLDLQLSFDTWRRLRKDQNLSPAQARGVIELMVMALVAARTPARS